MKRLICILFFLIVPPLLNAQGFDWQYSSRLPAEQPDIFVGIGVSYGLDEHYGSFSFFEDYFCGKYENGNGNGIAIDLNIEKWIGENTAIFIEAGWRKLTADFISRQVYEMIDEPLITEYAYNSSISVVRINPGIRYRLFDSKLSVGAILGIEYFISESSDFSEKVISPDWYHFDTDPPSQERVLTAGRLKGFSSIIVNPALQLAYGLNLGRGKYATPYFRAEFPINSFISGEDWRRYSLTFGISVKFGL